MPSIRWFAFLKGILVGSQVIEQQAKAVPLARAHLPCDEVVIENATTNNDGSINLTTVRYGSVFNQVIELAPGFSSERVPVTDAALLWISGNGGGVVGGYIPPAVCGGSLTGWYAARNLLGFGNGSQITTWPDLSGYLGHGDRTLVQQPQNNAGPGNLTVPTYLATFNNGIPGARFALVGGFDTALTALTVPQYEREPLVDAYLRESQWTVFVVAKCTSVADNVGVTDTGTCAGDIGGGFYSTGFGQIAAAPNAIARINITRAAIPINLGQPYILSARFDGANLRLKRDDVTEVSVPALSANSGFKLALGSGSFTASGHVAGFVGDLAEVLLYAGFCGDPNEQVIRDGLKGVYGL